MIIKVEGKWLDVNDILCISSVKELGGNKCYFNIHLRREVKVVTIEMDSGSLSDTKKKLDKIKEVVARHWSDAKGYTEKARDTPLYSSISLFFKRGDKIRSLKNGKIMEYSGYLTLVGTGGEEKAYDSMNEELVVYTDRDGHAKIIKE